MSVCLERSLCALARLPPFPRDNIICLEISMDSLNTRLGNFDLGQVVLHNPICNCTLLLVSKYHSSSIQLAIVAGPVVYLRQKRKRDKELVIPIYHPPDLLFDVIALLYSL